MGKRGVGKEETCGKGIRGKWSLASKMQEKNDISEHSIIAGWINSFTHTLKYHREFILKQGLA